MIIRYGHHIFAGRFTENRIYELSLHSQGWMALPLLRLINLSCSPDLVFCVPLKHSSAEAVRHRKGERKRGSPFLSTIQRRTFLLFRFRQPLHQEASFDNNKWFTCLSPNKEKRSCCRWEVQTQTAFQARGPISSRVSFHKLAKQVLS